MKEKRWRLDTLDAQIMSLLEDRFRITDEIMDIKRRMGIALLDEEREADILKRAQQHGSHCMKIYEKILEESKKGGNH